MADSPSWSPQSLVHRINDDRDQSNAELRTDFETCDSGAVSFHNPPTVLNSPNV